MMVESEQKRSQLQAGDCCGGVWGGTGWRDSDDDMGEQQEMAFIEK
jgi:hypothetical protein